MPLSLPSALSEFSKASQQNIGALDAIQGSVPNPQSVVQSNVVKSSTQAVTSQPTDLFNQAPSFVEQSNSKFLSGISAPPGFSPNMQTAAFGDVFGSGATSGSAVDAFLAENVRLEDIIPAQQIYQITKNLGNTSLYADPLQAYTHVAAGSLDIRNLCQEADAIIATLQADLVNLLSAQGLINYQQYAGMGVDFFLGAQFRATDAISKFSLLCSTLDTRGRFDPAQQSAFCNALDALANFVMFANTKIAQFEKLRQDIEAGMKRLREIGRDLTKAIENVIKFIPGYAAATAFGRIFQALQKKVCAQTNIDLGKILKDIEAFTSLNADDKSKVAATTAWAASIQAIKSYICAMQPSVDVQNPAGPVGPLKIAYDALAGALAANDPTTAFGTLDSQASTLSASMATGVTQNNSIDLAAIAGSVLATIAGLGVSLAATCLASTGFGTAFKSFTQLDPDRVVGSLDLYKRIGADSAKDVALANSGDTTFLAISESTSPGQLAESIKAQMATLPAGNEKDQLTLLYDEVQARHRATVLAMDFTRREDIRTFFAPDEAEANRQLVQKTVKTFSGIPRNQYDPVTTTG